MKRTVVLAVIIIVVVLIAFGGFWWYSHSKRTPNRIVVGLLSWPGDGPIYVGDEKGFFRDLNVDLSLQHIESYDSRRAALTGKQIDVDCTTLDQLLIYADNNIDANVYGLSDFSAGGDGIIALNTIETIKDLRGKTVAYAEATPSDFLLRWLLARQGMSIDDIQRKPVADAQAAGTAILAEKVDAAVTYEPWLTQSRDNPHLHIIGSTREVPNLIPGLFIARRSDLVARKDVYRRFMLAWYRSVNYLRQHPDESKAIMARRMGLTRVDLESVLNAIRILSQDENVRAFDRTTPQNLYELVGTISEFWSASGFIKKRPAADSLLYPLVN